MREIGAQGQGPPGGAAHQHARRVEGCTALLLTNGRRNEYHPEHTMVDGIIELHDVLFGTQAERELEVRKLRGTDALRGRHSFRITDRGIVVYPRIEALLARPTTDDEWPDQRCAIGVDQLDAMLGGGIPRGTATLVLGATGAGKTSLGLHFLSQSSAQEPGLLFGFYEMPAPIPSNHSMSALVKGRRNGLFDTSRD
jgi:circadian clock protein KaiC